MAHSPWVKRALDCKLSPASYDSFRPADHTAGEHNSAACWTCTPLTADEAGYDAADQPISEATFEAMLAGDLTHDCTDWFLPGSDPCEMCWLMTK